MAKKIPTSKPKTFDLSDFVRSGIEDKKPKKKTVEKGKRGRKPKKESDKFKRYTFTFPPTFMDSVDSFLKDNPFEARSRSEFFQKLALEYMNKDK